MAEKRNIRDVFGIDYLLNRQQAPAASTSGAIDFKLVGKMRKVLERLNTRAEKQAHVYQLADETDFSLEDVLNLTKEMQNRQFIHLVVSDDKRGNHLIEIARPGEQFLKDLS